MLSFPQFFKQPLDFCAIQRHIYLDGGVTGDAGRDPAAARVGILGLLHAILAGQNLFQHLLQLPAFEAARRAAESMRALLGPADD